MSMFVFNNAVANTSCAQWAEEIDLKNFTDEGICYRVAANKNDCYIEAAKKKKLSCGGDKRLIPSNAHRSGKTWKCDYGYQEKGLSCVKKTTPKIPKNAHPSSGGWTCNRDYYRDSSRTYCLPVPAHASSSYNSNVFICDSGWYKNSSRKSCRQVPKNGTKWANDYGFNCNYGYYKKGNSCIQTDTGASSIPENAHRVDNGWVCNKDFYRSADATICLPAPYCTTSPYDSNKLFCKDECELNAAGNSCIKKPSIPANSHKDGSSWTCNTNYYRNYSKTGCLRVPANAYSKYDSNYFYCNSGYIKNSSRTACVRETPTTKTTKKNYDDLTNVVVIIIGVVVVIGWLTSKPKPRPQPKPKPKPQPKPRRISVEDSEILFIKISDYDCNKLKNEFKKYNGRLNQVKTDKEKKEIQKIIDFIGKVRSDKDC